MTPDDLYNRFGYHEPKDRVHDHNRVRLASYYLATAFNDLLPEVREKELAVAKLEEAMFWANAAIARQKT